MTEETRLGYEQMEAAFYLVASDLCFLWFDARGDFVRPRVDACVCVRYTIGANLNDTFYWGTADTEPIPWDQVVDIANAIRGMSHTDQCWWFVDWAARVRGLEPTIPEVKAQLDEWRRTRETSGNAKA